MRSARCYEVPIDSGRKRISVETFKKCDETEKRRNQYSASRGKHTRIQIHRDDGESHDFSSHVNHETQQLRRHHALNADLGTIGQPSLVTLLRNLFVERLHCMEMLILEMHDWA